MLARATRLAAVRDMVNGWGGLRVDGVRAVRLTDGAHTASTAPAAQTHPPLPPHYHIVFEKHASPSEEFGLSGEGPAARAAAARGVLGVWADGAFHPATYEVTEVGGVGGKGGGGVCVGACSGGGPHAGPVAAWTVREKTPALPKESRP
jgi:hypothetical protein